MEHAARLGDARKIGGLAALEAPHHGADGLVAFGFECRAQRLAVQSVGFEPTERDDATKRVVHLERESTCAGLQRHRVLPAPWFRALRSRLTKSPNPSSARTATER
jgi:hypothetical protein